MSQLSPRVSVLSRLAVFWLVVLSLVSVSCHESAIEAFSGEAATSVQRTMTSGKFRTVAEPILNEYLVVFARDARATAGTNFVELSSELAADFGGERMQTFQYALNGFSVKMSQTQARALAQHPLVSYVEENGVVGIHAAQGNAIWNLDRVDQRTLPLSGSYSYATDGAGVHAYIVDTGIRATHSEFVGRIGGGTDTVGDGENGNDCGGHGTHVAGTVGGTNYGIAKGVTLHPVRVLGCRGVGSNASVIAGIDWVAANHLKPAVMNLSLGGSVSDAVDDAVRGTIVAGVTAIVAAGNSDVDACDISPARTLEAITVGATDKSDRRSTFSNWGRCLDVFAPGDSILSAAITSDTASAVHGGTSMAAPHVTGAAALYLSANPTASPAQVATALDTYATGDQIAGVGDGSPNVLLYTNAIGLGDDHTPPSSILTAPNDGDTVSHQVTLTATAADDTAVLKVQFYDGAQIIGEARQPPYLVAWNTARATDGAHHIFARAIDRSGNILDSSHAVVQIDNQSTATFDAALGAPACSAASARCDSGSLLTGRGGLGPELNAPNTLRQTCADGKSGTFHSDESIDAIVVNTQSGNDFGAGETVELAVTIWAWNATNDTVDLFHAADASEPVWTHLDTIRPALSGASTIRYVYTLPAGANRQAIRAAIRLNGTSAECTNGSYDDHDDLVITVR